MYDNDAQGNPAFLWVCEKHNNIDICLYSDWESETANNMEESSSAQRKPRRGNKCVNIFLLKRQKVSFIALERSGGWGGGEGVLG